MWSTQRERASLYLAASMVALASCGEDAAGPQAVGAFPNVLLISIDSLRADHLGCYGYERDTSPRIDRLSAEGVRVETAISSTSWTLPSHASLFTGRTNAEHGCDSRSNGLAESHGTLAEDLSAAGYETAGFWSGPYLHPVFGLGQGFDIYSNCASFGALGTTAETLAETDARSHVDVTSPRLTEEVTRWIEGREGAGTPFFLFVHMWDVHYDFIPPAPFDARFTDPSYQGPMDGSHDALKARGGGRSPADEAQAVGLYDGEIAWTDRHVGAILDALAKAGLEEGTLVVLTADHGEEFWEHGRFGHRKALFDESVRVPLIFRFPGVLPAGQTVEALAGLRDVAPTIADLVLLDRARDAAVMGGSGSSLAAALSGSEVPNRLAVAELVRPKRDLHLVSLRSAEWAIEFDLNDGPAGPLRGAWDLRVDPGQRRNLLGDEAGEGAIAAGLPELEGFEVEARSAFGALVRAQPGGAGERAIPEDVSRSLESFGYTGGDDDDH